MKPERAIRDLLTDHIMREIIFSRKELDFYNDQMYFMSPERSLNVPSRGHVPQVENPRFKA